MAEWCGQCGVEVWAYCLMTNHVHLIVVPSSVDGVAAAIGEAHRRYTRAVNFRQGWRGHLWQGRFASFPLDGPHLLAAARYVELNPVRAGMVTEAQAYRWSSTRAHLSGRDDCLVKAAPLLDMAGDWAALLESGLDCDTHATLRTHERTGRPLGDPAFVASLEIALGRPLAHKKPGPKSGGGSSQAAISGSSEA